MTDRTVDIVGCYQQTTAHLIKMWLLSNLPKCNKWHHR